MVQSASGKLLIDGTTHIRNEVLIVRDSAVIAPNTEKNVIK